MSAQIRPEDVEAIAGQGYRAIICNRPDGEVPDQPPFEQIEAAAKAHGVEVRYVPVVSGGLTSEDVVAFGEAMEELGRPLLAYCRSGTRSTALWSLHESKTRPASEILAATRAAGYDMTGVIG